MPVSLHGTNGLVFADGSSMASAAYTGFRNRIFNGNGRVNVRSAAGVSTNLAYGVDRWRLELGGSSLGASFAFADDGSISLSCPRHLYIQTTLAKANLAAGDYAFFSQPIEGVNIADLKWGGSSAKPVTLSFRARLDNAGASAVVSVSIRNAAADRSYVATITVTPAVQAYEIQIPGDTSGTWPVDTSMGLSVSFTHAVGSSLVAPAPNAWQAGNYLAAPGQTNLLATNLAAINVTDIQFEPGTKARPFENRPIGLEVLLCQRYARKNRKALGVCLDATKIAYTEAFDQPMRANPIATLLTTTPYAEALVFTTARAGSGSTIDASHLNIDGVDIRVTGFNSLTQGQMALFERDQVLYSAEL